MKFLKLILILCFSACSMLLARRCGRPCGGFRPTCVRSCGPRFGAYAGFGGPYAYANWNPYFFYGFPYAYPYSYYYPAAGFQFGFNWGI